MPVVILVYYSGSGSSLVGGRLIVRVSYDIVFGFQLFLWWREGFGKV